MYTDIWDLIGLYAPSPLMLPVEADPVYAALVAEHHKVIIRNPLHGLEGSIHLMRTGRNKTDFILYSADGKIEKINTIFMLPPLSRSYACNYTYYKLYLNLVAYLSGRKVGLLQLITVGAENTIHTMEYRPEVIERLLHDFELNHQPLPPECRTDNVLNSLAKGRRKR